MSSGIRGKNNFVDWPYASKVISKIKVKLWTGGGARGNDLDTQKLVYLMLGLSSIRMSNQKNFPAIGSMGCHRLPWRKKKNNKNGNRYNRCLRTFGAWPLNIAASSHYRGQAQSDDKTCQHCWKCQTNCDNEQLKTLKRILCEMPEKIIETMIKNMI